MATKKARQYDLILLGATGFTGKLTAEHISKALPTDLKWAIAGRNSKKLEVVVEEIKQFNPDRPRPAIEIAELTKSSLSELVEKTSVLISTVGPYHLYGTPVVEACANAGTHYIDCTGETPWVYDIVQKYHDTARNNGAILIPQCGIESAPADIIAYSLTSYNQRKFSAGTARLTHSVQSFAGAVSGGTALTAITAVQSYTLGHLLESSKPFSLAVSQPTAATSPSSLFRTLLGTQYVPDVGLLTDSLLGMQDTTLVYRSWGLIDNGRLYGNKFSYNTGMIAANRLTGLLWHIGMSIGTLSLLFPPVRWVLKRLVNQPGSGPAKEIHSKHFVNWKSTAQTDTSPSRTAVCNASYRGDMYFLTGILLAEAALVLLRPDRKNWAQQLGGGVLTPATLGDQYVERLNEEGLQITVEEA